MGAMAGANDMELLKRTNVGRDINRHYYTAQEVEENLKRPVVQALNALCAFRNTLPAFDGTFSYQRDGEVLTLAWEGAGTSAKLTFNPAAPSETGSIASLSWTDGQGEHTTDDLLANPPVAN